VVNTLNTDDAINACQISPKKGTIYIYKKPWEPSRSGQDLHGEEQHYIDLVPVGARNISATIDCTTSIHFLRGVHAKSLQISRVACLYMDQFNSC
jgi:hypothetical protein